MAILASAVVALFAKVVRPAKELTSAPPWSLVPTAAKMAACSAGVLVPMSSPKVLRSVALSGKPVTGKPAAVSKSFWAEFKIPCTSGKVSTPEAG